MQHLFPAKAPPEYWSAEYYKVMEEVVEQTKVKESAGHPRKSTAKDDVDNLLANLPEDIFNNSSLLAMNSPSLMAADPMDELH